MTSSWLCWFVLLLLAVPVAITGDDVDGDSDVAIDVDYSYDPYADNGPDEWSNLNVQDAENMCAGDRQSPIDIPTHSHSSCDTRVAYTFTAGTCTSTDVKFSLTNVAIRGDYPDKDDNGTRTTTTTAAAAATTTTCERNVMILPNGTSLTATQFHIHIGSEHTLNGVMMDAELHIVHANGNSARRGGEDGSSSLNVLGVLLQASSNNEDNADLNTLLNGWNTLAQQTLSDCGIYIQDYAAQNNINSNNSNNNGDSSFNIYDLLPSRRPTLYQYSGSLTTPPCTEYVEWHILEDPVKISAWQLQQLQTLVLEYYDPATCQLATSSSSSSSSSSYNGFTNRTTMPLNNRSIQRQCPTYSKKAALAGRVILMWVGGLVALLFAPVGIVLTAFSNKRKSPSIGSADKLLVDGKDSREDETYTLK